MYRGRTPYVFVSGLFLLFMFYLSVNGYSETRIDTEPPGVSYSRYAKISSDSSGHVYVAWVDTRNGRNDIYFNYSSDYGATWQANDIRLDTGDPPGASLSFNHEISSDDIGHVYVTWVDERNGRSDIYFNYSSDYGATWQSSDIRLDTGDPPGASLSYSHEISSDDSGHVYVTWVDERNGNGDIYFNYSSDYGVTWQTTDIRLDTGDPPGASYSYKLDISSNDSGHIYVIWVDERNGSGDIYFNYSSDYGVTWQTTDIRLDTGDLPGVSYSQFAQINSDDKGHVYVIWGRNGNIYLNYSSDYGATWQSRDIRLNADASCSSSPQISSDGNGHVYVTWGRNGNIYLNYSSDYGTIWQSRDVRIDTGDPVASNSGNPLISSDVSGYVYVAWPAWRNGSRDIYLNYSTDYGVTWQTTDIWLNTDDLDASASWNPQISSDGSWKVYVTSSKNRHKDLFFNSLDVPCSPDSYEPDDNSRLAATISSGVSQTHAICPIGDEDWVTFTLTSESGVVLETSGISSDTQIRLYDSSLNEMEIDDNGGTGNFSKINRLCGTDNELSAGTYYVKIDESGNDDEIFSYDISLTVTSCCSGSISTTSNSFVSSGGAGKVSVIFPDECSWTSLSNASWIDITSVSTGSGNETVSYSVLPNSGTSSRTGTITIAGKIFTITQNGDGRDEIIMDFGSFGTWIRWDSGTWTQLHTLSAGIITTGDLDGNGRDEIIMDFGSSGIWIRWDSGTWIQLHTLSAGIITTGDLDGNGRDEIIMDYGSSGIWIRWDSGTWTQLHTLSAGIITTGDIDGNGRDEIIMDFGSSGTWMRWDSGTWTQLHTLSAGIITTGDLDSNGKDEIIIDFEIFGIWIRMDSGTWGKLNSLSAEIIETFDMDGNGKDEIIVGYNRFNNPDFTGVEIRKDSGQWSALHSQSAGIITTCDIDGNGKDDIIMDFGSSGIWIRMDSGIWSKLHSQSAGVITHGNIDGN